MGIDHKVAREQIAPSAQLVQRERKQRCRPGGTPGDSRGLLLLPPPSRPVQEVGPARTSGTHVNPDEVEQDPKVD